ncbi:MAG: hypothetical protein KAQ75_17785 [Bacteroidales bacterium]|nr:hypothetical protein [Bacteroidales bacterium]
MKDKLINNIVKLDIGLVLISFIIQFYLFRTSFPFFKYPFIALFVILLCYLVFFHRKIIIKSLKGFINNYWLIIILFFVLLISFFLSSKIYLSVFKDIINVIILLSLFFILNILVKGKKELKTFLDYFTSIIILFSFFISFTGILSQLGIYEYVLDDSVKIDYNFALLPVLFGMIGSYYMLLAKKIDRYYIIILNIILYISTLNVFFAGSRRGIIVLGLIIIVLSSSQLLSVFQNNNLIKKLAYVSRYYLVSLVITAILLFFFATKSSCYFVNKSFDLVGSKNITQTKINLTANFYRYSTIFNRTEALKDFYNRVWSTEFDSRDPECGWGHRNGERNYPLLGEGHEMLPSNAIGFLIDSSSFNSFNRRRKNILIKRMYVEKGERYKAEIYCYVSIDFDGSKLGLRAYKKFVENSKKSRKTAFYDLDCKGTWQRLEFDFHCTTDTIPIMFSISKQSKERISFNGYIIMAYPTFTKIENNSILSLSNQLDLDKNHDLNIELVNYTKKDNKSIMIVDKSKSFIQKAGLINLDMLNEVLVNDKDPIRNFTAKFISEDTIYYSYKKDLFIDTLTSKFIGPRVNRWRFAAQIYGKEYNLKQKIFGGGFSFLNWYGYYFYHDKTKSDYPHNPFLYILLYSGIIGLVLYTYFMYKVFYYYLKYIKEYFILFIFFIITFFFTFFSGGNPFDPPIMGFFVILPFFIHSIHKKEI